MPNELYWKGKKVGSIERYTKEYCILDLDTSLSVKDLQSLTDSLRYIGIFVFLYDEDSEIIQKYKEAGFHYDETLLEECVSMGEHYVCYSKYRLLDKILSKKRQRL